MDHSREAGHAPRDEQQAEECGQFAIRVCITNHRTTDADLEALLVGVTDIARVLRS